MQAHIHTQSRPQGLANPLSLAGPHPWMQGALKLSPFQTAKHKERTISAACWSSPQTAERGQQAGPWASSCIMLCPPNMPTRRQDHTHCAGCSPFYVRLDKWHFFPDRQLDRVIGVRGVVEGGTRCCSCPLATSAPWKFYHPPPALPQQQVSPYRAREKKTRFITSSLPRAARGLSVQISLLDMK